MTKSRKKEIVRNTLLVVLVGTLLGVFFSLDLFDKSKGSLFHRSADTRLRFVGELRARDFPKSKIQELEDYIQNHSSVLVNVNIRASRQDSYGKFADNSSVLYEIQADLKSGAKIQTPTRRTTKAKFFTDVQVKLKKDIKAYGKVHNRDGKNNGTILTNTM